MDETQEEQNQKIQEFLGREFRWEFLAGECNFLIQLLAFIVQNNPAFVINDKGEKEPLDYQSIRSVVLLNEKLNGQLQQFAAEASVTLNQMKPVSERVQ